MDPVLVSEGDDETELLVVEAKIGTKQVHILNAYGPQETENNINNFKR